MNDNTVSDQIMCQAVNDKGMDIKLVETSQSDLNFAEDTHMGITCNTKTASTRVTYMKQQPVLVFTSTKTKSSDKYVGNPKSKIVKDKQATMI